MSWDWLKIETRRAAKRYVCAEAKCEIAKGDRYQYTVGKIEGDLDEYRLCMACATLATAYCSEISDEGFPLGDLRRSLTEDEGIADLDVWLAEVAAREAARAQRASDRQSRIEALGSAVICGRCGATLATYADQCSAALDDACPGFMAIEQAGAPQ